MNGRCEIRIYVSGPYSAPTEGGRLDNTNRAIDAGLALMRKGHDPLIPHLSHYSDERALVAAGARVPWEEWMRVDLAFVDVCEGFLYLSPSRGADIELARAVELRKVIFTAVEDVPAEGTSHEV